VKPSERWVFSDFLFFALRAFSMLVTFDMMNDKGLF